MSPYSQNQRAGWLLLTLAFVAAVPLDMGFGRADFHALGADRSSQIALLRAGLLQILSLRLLGARTPSWTSLGVLAAGLFYAAAFVTRVFVPSLGALLVVATSFQALVVGALVMGAFRRTDPWWLKGRYWVLLLGLILDVSLSFTEWDPSRFLPAYLAPVDSVRMRMLQLARIATLALPLLATLQEELTAQAPELTKTLRRAQTGIRMGALGMPTLLVGAGLTWTNRKGGVMFFTLATIYGVWAATFLAKRREQKLETLGWASMLVAMVVGLGVSAYSFGGPFPTPRVMGEYVALTRTMVRQAHTYGIVLGFLLILMARDKKEWSVPAYLLIGGGLLTVGLLTVGSGTPLPALAFAVGPALVALGGLAHGVASR